MEKKKVDLSVMAGEAGKNAKAFWGKVKDSIVKAVDQNDDGTFDMEDVLTIAESLGNAAKNTATAVKNSAEERSREMERKALQPIFVEDLDSTDFSLPKLVCITEMDKKRAESEVCKGSIGYVSTQKELRIINIFKDKISDFGLSMYPECECGLYYVDPSDRDKYIALEDYFSYLKVARINELQKIAQDLGAKHFKVTYKEQKSTSSNAAVKANVLIKSIGNSAKIDADHNIQSSSNTTVEVAAEMDCPGHAPIEPKLYYLQREPSIQSLIALRMDKDSPITHQKYTLKLSNTSGIKETDAVKIDAALKAMKLTGNTTITSEVRNESNRFFEYEIDF